MVKRPLIVKSVGIRFNVSTIQRELISREILKGDPFLWLDTIGAISITVIIPTILEILCILVLKIKQA